MHLQGLRSLCVRLQSALQDAASQRAVAQLSRSSSRRLTRGDSGRGAIPAPGQERRSLGSRSSSLRQSRRSYEVNLAAERGALPAGGACVGSVWVTPAWERSAAQSGLTAECSALQATAWCFSVWLKRQAWLLV